MDSRSVGIVLPSFREQMTRRTIQPRSLAGSRPPVARDDHLFPITDLRVPTPDRRVPHHPILAFPMPRNPHFIKRSAAKELEGLPLSRRRRVVTRMRRLATDPRPHGCEKLSGEEKYRIRQGPYRVLCTIDDTACEVVIVRIAQRRDVYR
jgi:mRNA interferase RelE/StbE